MSPDVAANITRPYSPVVEPHIAHIHGGWQVAAHFPNGYGVSIVQHSFSYGLEMAVLHDDRLCYATPVTNDVIGHLHPETLAEAVRAVAGLPERADCTHAHEWSAA